MLTLDFSWEPFYSELAYKLLPYKNKRNELEKQCEQILNYINYQNIQLTYFYTKKLGKMTFGVPISVNKESGALVTAVEISQDAIDLAKENAKLNNAQVDFVLSDMFSGVEGLKFDVIISNPPYIKSQDIVLLQKEVKDFEPNLALDGGEDGYDFYKTIAKNAKTYLNDGGVLIMECGIGQAQDIKNMLTDFSSVEIIKDYENIERIVKAVL